MNSSSSKTLLDDTAHGAGGAQQLRAVIQAAHNHAVGVMQVHLLTKDLTEVAGADDDIIDA